MRRLTGGLIALALCFSWIGQPAVASENPIAPENRMMQKPSDWDAGSGLSNSWYFGATFQGGQNPGAPPPLLHNRDAQKFCSELTSACSTNQPVGIRGYAKLCDGTERVSACVRSVELSTDGENWTKASFVKYFDVSTSNKSLARFDDHFKTQDQLGKLLQVSTVSGWSENSNWDAPESGKGPLVFQVPGHNHTGGSNQYLLNLRYEGTVDPARKQTVYDDFSTALFPIELVNYPRSHPPVEFISRFPNGEVKHLGTGPGFGSAEFVGTDEVAYSARFAPETQVRVTLDYPKVLGGWFHTRLSKPNLGLTSKNSYLNTLVIAASPAEIPITNVFVDGLDPRYQAIVEKYEDPYFLEFHRKEVDAGRGGGASGGVWESNSGVGYFRDWSPYMSQQAKGSAQAWLVTVLPKDRLGSNQCMNDTSVVHGLINTNAMVYQSDVPVFRNGFIEYQVAGVHRSSIGEVNRGEYDLQIRSSTARCLYGYDKAPVSASVQVVSNDGNKEFATIVVSEKAGWLKLAAYGFTFSTKKIRVKLNQNAGIQVAKFAGVKTKLTATQKAAISSQVAGLQAGAKVTCTANFTNPSQKALALSRAKSVCGYARKLNSQIQTKSVATLTKNAKRNQAVLIAVS